MAATCHPAFHPGSHSRAPLRSPRLAAGAGLPVWRPLALAAVLVMLALVLAPEHPGDQEAICNRHNGEAACRVW